MKIFRITLLAFLLPLLFCSSLSAQRSLYKKIKVFGNTEEMQSLVKQGVCMDHGDYKKGAWFSSWFNTNEFNLIKQSGLKFEILEDGALPQGKKQADNSSLSKMPVPGVCVTSNTPVYPVPSHFKLGSMGGFFTYSELLLELDSMALLYPNLITVKQPIDSGLTWDGNPIYFVKISDNANLNEPEPQVYYSSLHHAREPLSMQQMIYYMWYLLENYQNDSLVKNIVDNRELYIVPCLNPDGYLYNELTDPNGGGMWRKNRRDNLDGTHGVDLNRNYDIFWGYDDNGSSPNTISETYRGTFPASEPEIQMVTNFINAHQFVTALDYHTYGDHLLYPWSHIADYYTPDSAIYVTLADMYTTYNHYQYGTCNQTLNYLANGGSFDWLYGEQSSKPKIFDFTPECGYDFWPAVPDILPIIQGAIHMDVLSALVAGKYAKVEDATPMLISNANGYVYFSLQQLGLDTNASYTVSVTGLSPQVSATGSAKTFSNLNYFQVINDSISYALNGTQVNGTALKFLLTIDFGSFQMSDTLIKYFGTPVVLYADNGSNLNGWTGGSLWGTTTSSFYSPPSSITDSPVGNYFGGINNPLQLTSSINLTNAVKAGLSFYAHWLVEVNSDYVEVQASDDNGISWMPLCGKYTRPGTFYQDPGMPIYDGTKTNWVAEEMSLDDYLGQNILIRFLLVSDGFDERDGFYFDDLSIWSMSNNTGMADGDSPVFLSDAWPNPTSGTADISYSIPSSEAYILTVTNALGQVVSTMPLDHSKNSVTINLEQEGPGVYYAKIGNDGRNFAMKRIVVLK